MKLGGNPFRTILHISFFEAHFFGGGGAETDPRPDRRPSAYPRSGLLGGGSGNWILEVLELVASLRHPSVPNGDF